MNIQKDLTIKMQDCDRVRLIRVLDFVITRISQDAHEGKLANLRPDEMLAAKEIASDAKWFMDRFL